MTTLLVASTGGHLKEMDHLRGRFVGVEGPFRWVTFDTPQSRSLLSDADVDFVPFVGGRDPLNVMRNFATAGSILREHRVSAIVSTGSAVALPFFALGRSRRLPCHFIESAARSDGPSMTGKLIGGIPGVCLYTQYPAWAGDKWHYRGSVFDSFERRSDADRGLERIAKAVVSLGTYRGYGFPRIVRRLLEVLPPEAEVLWQTGDTDVSDFDIAGHYALPERDLIEAMREADVVIAHAGVGTALAALEVGKCPLLVPRRLALGEHVDDHQIQVARELGDRDLAICVDADELNCEHLLQAANASIGRLAQAPALALRGA